MVGRTRTPFRRIGLVAANVLALSSMTAAAQEIVLPTRLASDAPVELAGRNQEKDEVAHRARSEEHLARQLQNPVADLISMPLQSDFDGDLGPDQAGFRYTMNLQPVLPFDLGDGWLLVTRTILPIVYQHDVLGQDTGRAFGLGDTLQSFFLSPKDKEGLIWGLGPAFLWPTATRDILGGEKWALGPTAVVLMQSDLWTAGVLTNHLWSYAGSGARADVNQTLVQPFVALTLSKGTSFHLLSESIYDWHADQWTVPVLAGVSQVLKMGDQPISIGVIGKYWVEGPSTTPDWGVRFVVTLLFPH